MALLVLPLVLMVPLMLPIGSVVLYLRLRKQQPWIVPAGYVAVGLCVVLEAIVRIVRIGDVTHGVNPDDRATILAAGLSELMNELAFIGLLLLPVSLGAFFLDRHLRRRQKPAP